MERNKKFRRITGLVLGTKDVGEGDKLVILLSPELGKYNLMAYGANRFKSRFSNKINTSNIIRAWVRFPSSVDKIPSLEDIEVLVPFFDEFKSEPEKLFYVNFVSEVVYYSIPNEVFDEDLYNVLLKFFSRLVESSQKDEVFRHFAKFLIDFLKLQGILPYIKEENIKPKTKAFIVSIMKGGDFSNLDFNTKLDFIEWIIAKIQKVIGNRKIISFDLVKVVI